MAPLRHLAIYFTFVLILSSLPAPVGTPAGMPSITGLWADGWGLALVNCREVG